MSQNDDFLPTQETTAIKYLALSQIISKFSIKDKRNIFQCIRDIDERYEQQFENHQLKQNEPNTILQTFPTNVFLPKQGCTVGEFCTLYLLNSE